MSRNTRTATEYRRSKRRAPPKTAPPAAKTSPPKAVAPPRGGGRSIARRLSRKLFFRQLRIFIALNLFVCLITAVALIVYSETKLDSAVYSIEDTGQNSVRSVLHERLEGDAEYGYQLPRGIASLLPEHTASMRRWINWYERGLLDEIEVTYNLVFSHNGQTHWLIVDLSDFMYFYTACFIVMCIWELLNLISKSRKNSKLIHRSLDPIWELTHTAEMLGRAADRSEPDMTALKGALDRIDALGLDTRIEIDATQQELQGLAAAINDMLDRIRAAYEAQIRFVSDASHELRTPISVIQGYANLLDRWGKNDETTLQEGIDAIRSEAESMKALVEQLLFLARGDNNSIALTPEPINLRELFEEIEQDTKLIDQTHEFRMEAEEIFISADRQLIKQAVRVLVDNAIKYTDPGGQITIRARAEGESAVLSVTDTGVGIEEDLLPKIFDRFVRADESRTRSSGGAGLGLAICKWIVARHGGHIEVLSRTGTGTRISIILPLTRPALIRAAVAEPAEVLEQ